jgi:hypothetical protein
LEGYGTSYDIENPESIEDALFILQRIKGGGSNRSDAYDCDFGGLAFYETVAIRVKTTMGKWPEVVDSAIDTSVNVLFD